jgi:putative flippase GtrA
MSRLLSETATVARFGGVGAIATLVHVAMAGVVLWLWPTLSPFLANVIAFLVAFQISLWGHRRFTFRKAGRGDRFFALALAGFALNNGVLGALLAATPLDDFPAIVIATFAVPLLMYVAARFWAFA